MRAYRVRLALGALALACVGAPPSRAGNEPPAAYQWPSKPADEILKKAEAMGGERGLVVLARRCVLEIRSYNTIGPGVTREVLNTTVEDLVRGRRPLDPNDLHRTRLSPLPLLRRK